MNFKQQLSNYVLGNLNTADLPKIAIYGLENGLHSESLLILASLSAKDNPFDIDIYFKKALSELDFQIPDKKTATFEIIRYYVDLIKDKKIEPLLGVEKIIDEVLLKTDVFDNSKKYAYDCIGFEKIYSLYDTCCELLLSDRPWSKEKSNQTLIDECKNDLEIEIGNWINKSDNYFHECI